MRRAIPTLAVLLLAACSGGTPGFGGLDATPYPDGQGPDALAPDGEAGDEGRDPFADLPPFEVPPQDPGQDPGLDAAPDAWPADVPVPEMPYPLCQPCRSDLECETADVKAPCLPEGPSGSTCGFPCNSTVDCPEGFDCLRHDLHGYQCRPSGGAPCPCIERFVTGGFQTACWRENELGRCDALRTCDQECPAPLPAPEACNGLDDDCDGTADQGLGTTTCGEGQCQVTVQNCVAGQPRQCVPGEPRDEECNLLDDDCDGATDDGIPPLRCGVGACAVEVAACLDGRPQPCWPLPESPETCNGLDDDCDGAVDDGIAEVACGLGACRRVVPGCTPDGPGQCVPGEPAPEACNGVDDDCDGDVDEDLGTVTCGTGPCARTVPACQGGQAVPCVPGAPGKEDCNGIDDDCDGRRDEEGCKCPLAERDGRLYLLCTAKAKWKVARDTCASWGYHLAVIGDAAENTFVVDTARAVSTDAWWIGLSDLEKEGTWAWVDGSPASYLPWGERQPNNGGIAGNQDCVLFQEPAWGAAGRYLWNDANCGNDGDSGDFLNFVCEHP